MKAITLTQPWASLVAFGAKKIETRTWATAYRGEIAVHAAKTWTKAEQGLVAREPFKGALRGLTVETMPLGVVVAVAELTHVALMSEYRAGTCEKCAGKGILSASVSVSGTQRPGRVCDQCRGAGGFMVADLVAEPERSFGGYAPGRFGIFIQRPRLVPYPVEARGQLNIYELATVTAEAVKAQLEDVDERAGILEADAGLTRAEAERLAFDFVRDGAAYLASVIQPKAKGHRGERKSEKGARR